MRTITYLAGIAIGIFGIIIFHPLLTLIGIGLTLLVHLPKEENNA
jgi:hypothetical protein